MTNLTDSLTLRQKERLERLWKRYNRFPLHPDSILDAEDNLNLNLETAIAGVTLRHPFIVAAWAVPPTPEGFEKAHRGVWAAAILPTAAAEDAEGNCLLSQRRSAPRPFTSAYERRDTHREYPRVERPKSLFPSDIAQYAALAKEAAGVGIPAFASLSWGNDSELFHTVGIMKQTGIQGIELVPENSVPSVFDFGIPVFVRHGLQDVHTGVQAFRLLQQGHPVIPVFSLLVGKVRRPPKISFNRYEQVLYRLLFHPEDGFLAAMAGFSNREGMNSVLQIVTSSASRQEASR